MKYQRRTDDDRIAELNAKIEGIRERAVREAARANPAVQQATIALRAITKAIEAGADDGLREALDTASGVLRVALDWPALPVAAPEPPRAARARRTKATEPKIVG